MNYCIYIGGQTHKLVQGVTISEELNETLDSATVIIPKSPQLDLNPYDDVFIFGEWCGYYDKIDKIVKPIIGKKFIFKGYPVNSTNYDYGEMPCFYKHFLIDQFTEDMIIMGGVPENTTYKYKLELFSETKGTEKVSAPNVSVTQPLDSKISTVTYLNRFLNLYNKKKKVLNENFSDYSDFHYEDKYTLANANSLKKKYTCLGNYIDKTQEFPFEKSKYYLIKNLKGTLDNSIKIINAPSYFSDTENTVIIVKWTGPATYNIENNYEYAREVTQEIVTEDFLEVISDVFGDNYCPDFTLNAPTLRQILDKFLITKDRIAVIRDDEVYAMDITKRRGNFDLTKGEINYVSGSKSSSNYCTELRRTYTDGLSQDNTGRLIEYLGFRNSDVALMTLENMRLETRFPIYKINKLYMCYLKKVNVSMISKNGVITTRNKVFVCKHDITKLVKLNSERNVLSEDANMYGTNPPTTIDGLSKYKFGTLGYDIGSQTIEGWGDKFYYPGHFFWQDNVKSYIQGIYEFLESHENSYGIYNANYIIQKVFPEYYGDENYFFNVSFPLQLSAEKIAIPNYDEYDNSILSFDFNSPDYLNNQNLTLQFKHIFFEMEYTPFFSGTIIHSKGLGSGNITTNDNQSSSLALLENDGLAQIEKLNRYGNKAIVIPARYKEINEIQSLGSVYEKNNDTDVVIYHKEYSINDNVINCTYYGSKDYVLKDYFTSVFARYRTYNLMSYNESITRAENEKIYLFLSKEKYYNDKFYTGAITGIDNNFKEKLISFFKPHGVNDIVNRNQIKFKDKINYGFFKRQRNNQTEYYATDSNIFVSGNSLCFNIVMKDNVTLGNYIKNIKNNYLYSKENNYMVGSTQDYVWLTDDSDDNSGGTTGRLTSLGCYFGHIENFIGNEVYDEGDISDSVYSKLFNLPKISNSLNITSQIGFTKVFYKDNKDRLDITTQIEPLVDDDIFISPWFFKLSDLYGVYKKFNQDLTVNYSYQKFKSEIYLAMYGDSSDLTPHPFDFHLVLIIKKEYVDNNSLNGTQSGGMFYPHGSWNSTYGGTKNVSIYINNFSNVSSSSVTVSGLLTMDRYNSNDEFISQIVARNNNLVFAVPSSTDIVPNDELFAACGLANDKDNYYLFKVKEPEFYVDNYTYSNFGVSGTMQQTPNIVFYENEPVSYPFEKNLYWVYVPVSYDFKHYMVYDSFSSLPSNFTQTNVTITWANDGSFIQVSHPDVSISSYILCYYKYKGKYEFVFGFKSNNGTTTKIYISHLYSNDMRVFDSITHLPVSVMPDSNELSIMGTLEFSGYLDPVTMIYYINVEIDSDFPDTEYTFGKIVASGLNLPYGQNEQTFLNQTVDSENEISLTGNYRYSGSDLNSITVNFYNNQDKRRKRIFIHEVIDEHCFEHRETIRDVTESSPGYELYNLNFRVKNKMYSKTITFSKVEFEYYVTGQNTPQHKSISNITLGPDETYSTVDENTTLQDLNINLTYQIYVKYYIDDQLIFSSDEVYMVDLDSET